MGRHSPHRSSSRRDRESPHSRSDRDKDRSHGRERSSKSSKSENAKDISKMKEKIRAELDSAKSHSSVDKGDKDRPKIKEEVLTEAEVLERSRAIEQIDEGGFQPAAFKSSQGGAGGRVYSHKQSSSTDKKNSSGGTEKSHDTAIFGPSWKSEEQRRAIDSKQQKIKTEVDLSDVHLPSEPKPVGANAPMIPESMNAIHSERRQANWLKIWHEQRRNLLSV